MTSRSALRIRYEYDQNGVRPVSKRRVPMIVPDPVTPPPQGNEAGLWCELRDGQGKLLYHRALHHSLGHDVEVFSADPNEPVHRVPAADHGAFDVVVPDVPEAAAIALVGPYHPSATLRAGPVWHELATIPETAGGGP